MTNIATVHIENTQTELALTRPKLIIHVSASYAGLTQGTSIANDVIKLNRITREAGRPSIADFSLILQDEDDNTVYLEDILSGRVGGVDIKTQITDKYYVMVSEDTDEAGLKILFCGTFNAGTLSIENNEYILSATGLETIMWQNQIQGKYSGSGSPVWAPYTSVIFNEDGKDNIKNGTGALEGQNYFFDLKISSGTGWNCKQMIDYIDDHFDNTLTSGASSDSYDYPCDLSDKLQTKYCTEFAGSAVNYTPQNIDITGLSYYAAYNEVIRNVGAYQVQFDYHSGSNGTVYVEAMINPTDNPTSAQKHNLNWGQRSVAPTVDADFSAGSIFINRSHQYKKVVCTGQRTKLQVTMYTDLHGAHTLPVEIGSAVGGSGVALKLSEDWPDTLETLFDNAADQNQTAYNSVYSKYALNTIGNRGFFNDSPLNGVALETFPLYSDQYIQIDDTLLVQASGTNNGDDRDSNTELLGWYKENDSWHNIRELNIACQLRTDRGGIIIHTKTATEKKRIKNLDALVFLVTVTLDDRIRSVAGLVDGIISTDETAIDQGMTNMDEVLYIRTEKYQKKLLYPCVANYDSNDNKWYLASGCEKNRVVTLDDRSTEIQDYATALMKRQMQRDNSGSIVAPGFKQWRAGDFLEYIKGAGRTIHINSWIQALTFDYEKYQTNIQLGSGI